MAVSDERESAYKKKGVLSCADCRAVLRRLRSIIRARFSAIPTTDITPTHPTRSLPFAPRTATSPAPASDGERLSLDGLIEVATFTLDGADQYR